MSSFFPKDPDKRLNIWTNISLVIAVLLGLIVAIIHGGEVTVSIAAFGSALGVGGVLGFLFGIPGASQAHISIGRVDSVAVSSGRGSRMVSAVNEAPQPVAQAAPPDQQPAPPPVDAAPANLDAAVAVAPNDAVQAAAPAAPQLMADSAAANGNTATTQPAASNLEQVADWVTKLLLGGGLTQMQRIPPKIWQWSRNIAVGITGGGGTEPALQAQQAFAAGVLVYGFVLGFFAGFLITKLQLGKAVL